MPAHGWCNRYSCCDIFPFISIQGWGQEGKRREWRAHCAKTIGVTRSTLRDLTNHKPGPWNEPPACRASSRPVPIIKIVTRIPIDSFLKLSFRAIHIQPAYFFFFFFSPTLLFLAHLVSSPFTYKFFPTQPLG